MVCKTASQDHQVALLAPGREPRGRAPNRMTLGGNQLSGHGGAHVWAEVAGCRSE
jgi:hypothetical protein